MFQWIKDSIDLVIPHTCASCHVILARPDAGLCIHCLNRIQALVKGCDHELTQRLGKHKNQVRRGYALMYFEQHGVSQHLIHKIKYHNGEHLARPGTIPWDNLTKPWSLHRCKIMPTHSRPNA